MKTIKLLFIAFLLLQSAAIFGQEQESIPEVHPDLDNPKVQEAIRLIEAEDYNGAQAHYKKVFQSNNRKDIKDLFIYDLSRIGTGRIMDLLFNAEFEDEIKIAVEDIMKSGDSPSEKFQKALVYTYAGFNTYKDPQQTKEYLNSPFHVFLQLATQQDWIRPIPLLRRTATELYKIGFEDEHLDMDILLATFDYEVNNNGYTPSVIGELADGFYYENSFGVPLTADEEKANENYLEISQAVTYSFLANNPENTQPLMIELWERSLSRSSFDTRFYKFRSGYAESLSDFISELDDDEDIKYNDIKIVEILYNSFFNEDSEYSVDDLIELTADKETAYNILIGFLNYKKDHFNMDLMGVSPKWVNTFKDFIVKNPEYLSLAIRYGDEIDVLLADNRVNIESLEKSLDFVPETLNVMSVIVQDDEMNENGLGLYTLYGLARKMDKIREHGSFKKNRNIKHLQAKARMTFELTYLKDRGIHSPSIIGLSDIFDDWNQGDMDFSSEEVEIFLSEYLDIYTESPLADASMEKVIIIDILKDVATKFELI